MKLTSFFIIICLSFSSLSCKKGVEPVDGSKANIELRGTAKGFITGNVTVNPNDSIFFDFTVTSQEDMGFVSVQKNPVNQTAFIRRDTLNASNKYSYTAVMRFRADSANGSYVYRIAAHTNKGVYIGHRDIVITIEPDYYNYTNRFLYAPDTTGKNNKCYISVTDGAKTFSYNEGVAASSTIDFGYFYDTAKTLVNTTLVTNGHTIYALSNNQFPSYDISSWTKNATIFKRLSSGAPNPTFANALSAGTLKTAGMLQLSSGTTNRVNMLNSNSPINATVYFRTASGKVGMLFINFATVATNASGGIDTKQTFINIDVKVQK